MKRETAFLPRSFFDRPTLEVARQLLGAKLGRLEPGGRVLSGIIIETEAYIGQEDRACHARHGRTPRNEPMWGPSGHSYVYFTYGMHWLLNVVTEADGFPAAVLIRGMLPEDGIEIMRQRRGGQPDSSLTDGPGKLCQAMAIDSGLSGMDLCRPDSPLRIWHGQSIPDGIVTTGTRVGLNSVPEPWRSKPWRFHIHRKELSKLKESEDHHGIT
jgi:DNA-3-methyladenine glycosylase